MRLLSLVNRVPPERFTQERVWKELEESEALEALKESSRALLRKILLGNSGISERQLAATGLRELLSRDAQALNHAFEREAVKLSAHALSTALEHANLLAAQLDALLVCTCTGYLCPGLSSFIAERCGLRQDTHLGDLVGLGCGAALPLLRMADACLLQGARYVACVAVEICSAAFYLDDDPGVLVSFCLFGDGASASIWTRDKNQRAIGRLGTVHSLHWPEVRESLRFVNARGKLKNVLAPTVPEIGARAVHELLIRSVQQPGNLVVHPGGKKVLDAIAARFPCEDLAESRQVLRAHGNMSSPSVLFALEQWLKNRPRARHATLTSFGAGFTCHAANFSRD